MSEVKWYGRVIYDREGIELESTFNTEAEAEAYCAGFEAAKEILEAGDCDELDDYFAGYSSEKAREE